MVNFMGIFCFITYFIFQSFENFTKKQYITTMTLLFKNYIL